MPDQVVEFEGATHHFPDDFTDADISKALASMHPVPVPLGQQPASFGGVLGTMYDQAGRAVGAAADWLNPMNLVNTIRHPYESTVGGSARSLDAAEAAAKQGQYGEAALHGLGALPVIGPPGEQILRDIGGGNIPELIGHAGAAYLLGKSPKAATVAPEIARNAPAIAKGVGKGMAKGAMEPLPGVTKFLHKSPILTALGIPDMIPGSVAAGGIGYEAGKFLPDIGPPIGAAVGAAVPPLIGGVKGGLEAWRNRPRPTPTDIMPMPKLLGPGTPDTSGPIPFTPPDYWNNPPRSPSGGLTMPPAGAPPDIQTPKPAAQPPQSPVGPHVQKPHIPAHYADEPNMEAAFKNDKAVVRELNKVGINSENLTPDIVHVTRKAIGQRALKPADVDRRVGHVRWLLDHPEWQSPD